MFRTGTNRERPLSPHLQIYRPSLTMMMSIAHRISGAGLYFGMVFLAWWLIAAASGEEYFSFVNSIIGSVPGRIVLLGLSWALIHHLLGGVRHLIWDTGSGFERRTLEIMAWLNLLGGAGLTILLWLAAYWMRAAG